jgi:hypothetical protein
LCGSGFFDLGNTDTWNDYGGSVLEVGGLLQWILNNNLYSEDNEQGLMVSLYRIPFMGKA